jgi:hypothetical protein
MSKEDVGSVERVAVGVRARHAEVGLTFASPRKLVQPRLAC